MKPTPLKSFLQAHGALFEENTGWEAAKNFSNPASEHLAVRNTVGLSDLSHYGKIFLEGAECRSFLHGIVTNDIRNLKDGKGVYAALLSHIGRMQGDLTVFAIKGKLLIRTDPEQARRIIDLLNNSIVSEDVQVKDQTDGLSLIALNGPKARLTLEKVFGAIPALSLYDMLEVLFSGIQILLTKMAYTGEEGYEIFCPVQHAKEVFMSLISTGKDFGLRLVGSEALNSLRIEAGVPKYGIDMDETIIPLEARLENAIHYNKGCYVGQEVIARVKRQALWRKLLVGLEVERDQPPVKGDKIFNGRKEVGWVTSGIVSPTFKKTIALGYVQRDFTAPGTELSISIAGTPITATIVELPFYNRAM